MYQAIGSRLKIARIAAGYDTATQFCEKFNIPQSTYSLHETGKRGIKVDLAHRYAELLNIEPAWLITGTGNPYPDNAARPAHLSIAEFNELVQYHQLTASGDNTNRELVEPFLFGTILIEMEQVQAEFSQHITRDAIINHTLSVYSIIIKEKSDRTEQFNAITTQIVKFIKLTLNRDASLEV